MRFYIIILLHLFPSFQPFHVLIKKIVEVIYSMALFYIILFVWLDLSWCPFQYYFSSCLCMLGFVMIFFYVHHRLNKLPLILHLLLLFKMFISRNEINIPWKKYLLLLDICKKTPTHTS